MRRTTAATIALLAAAAALTACGSDDDDAAEVAEVTELADEGDAAPTASASVCELLTVEEVETFLGGPLEGDPISESARDGAFRACDWYLAGDPLTTLGLTVDLQEDVWDPTGWVREEVVPVDGLGEESFATMDYGMRVGFLRDGATVYLTAPNFYEDRLPDAIELARLVEARL